MSPIALDRVDALNGRFSNRPFRVKHFQTIHPSSVDVRRVLSLRYIGGPELFEVTLEGAHGRYRFAITKTMRCLFGTGCKSSIYGRILKFHDGRHHNIWT